MLTRGGSALADKSYPHEARPGAGEATKGNPTMVTLSQSVVNLAERTDEATLPGQGLRE